METETVLEMETETVLEMETETEPYPGNKYSALHPCQWHKSVVRENSELGTRQGAVLITRWNPELVIT